MSVSFLKSELIDDILNQINIVSVEMGKIYSLKKSLHVNVLNQLLALKFAENVHGYNENIAWVSKVEFLDANIENLTGASLILEFHQKNRYIAFLIQSRRNDEISLGRSRTLNQINLMENSGMNYGFISFHKSGISSIDSKKIKKFFQTPSFKKANNRLFPGQFSIFVRTMLRKREFQSNSENFLTKIYSLNVDSTQVEHKFAVDPWALSMGANELPKGVLAFTPKISVQIASAENFSEIYNNVAKTNIKEIGKLNFKI